MVMYTSFGLTPFSAVTSAGWWFSRRRYHSEMATVLAIPLVAFLAYAVNNVMDILRSRVPSLLVDPVIGHRECGHRADRAGLCGDVAVSLGHPAAAFDSSVAALTAPTSSRSGAGCSTTARFTQPHLGHPRVGAPGWNIR